MSKKLNEILADAAKREELEVRFWAKVDRRPASECWPWISRARHKFGYGIISSGRSSVALNAHRVAWALSNGPIPEGAHILHTCDNPPCCNPAHLYAGTDADNKADKHERGRGRPKGYRHSEETKQKIREGRAKNPPRVGPNGRMAQIEALRRVQADPEWRARFKARMSGPNNPRFGKRPPDHQIEAIKRALTGKPGRKHSEETKQKMRELALAREAARRMKRHAAF